MTTIHQRQTAERRISRFDCPSTVAFVKGAPDIILDLCDQILIDGKPSPDYGGKEKGGLGINQDMARQALRVLGVAYRPMDGVPQECTSETVEEQTDLRRSDGHDRSGPSGGQRGRKGRTGGWPQERHGDR